MSSRQTFLYFLFSNNKKPLYFDDNKQIQEGSEVDFTKANGELAHLEHAPDGWRDTLVKYARNIKYFGVFRDMTIPMKFVVEGANILRNRLWMYGTEVVCYLGIAKLDRTSLPYSYKSWYLSEINFVKHDDAKDFFTVEALEGGASKYLKANESTTYEFDIMHDSEQIALYMDGMELENSAEWVITNGVSTDPNSDYKSHILDCMIISKEIDKIGGVFDSTRTQVEIPNNNLTATGQYIVDVTTNGTLVFEWDFEAVVNFVPPPGINPGATYQIVIRALDAANFTDGAHQLTLLSRTAAQGIPGTYHLKGTGSLNLEAGRKVYLYCQISPIGSTGDAQIYTNYGGTEPFIKVAYTYKGAPTTNNVLTLWRMFNLIVNRMTEGKYKAKSSWLQTPEMLEFCVTSGDALRGFLDATLKTSFADFFKSLDSRWGVGVGIEGDYIVLEPLSYFFQDFIIADVGEVKGAKINYAEDLAFNTIKNGYKAVEYKEINGRMEFNQGQWWSTKITKITKELDKVSVYRADSFGIELLRINFAAKRTTDTESDNDVFFVHIKQSVGTSFQGGTSSYFDASTNQILIEGNQYINQLKSGTRFTVSNSLLNNRTFTVVEAHNLVTPFILITVQEVVIAEANGLDITITIPKYILNRPPYSSVIGLLHPLTAFNIELSPHRGLLSNGAFLHSVLDYMEIEVVKFEHCDKNGDLETTLAGVTIKENADIQISSLAPKLFRPYYISFTTEVPVNLLELMNANPYGKIKFHWNKQVWYGYLCDGGLKPDTLDAQQWKLLCAPENNLLTFNYE